MKFLLDKQEAYTLVALEEDHLDSVLTPLFKSELVTLSAEGARNMIIDLSKVKHADASSVSALLVANNLCRDAGGSLAICGVAESIMVLIRISQLEATLNVVPTLTEAIEFIAFSEIEAELRRALEE